MLAAEPHGKHTARLEAAGEVFAAFLKLGLTSFGGPIAHLGYYRRELIERRHWVDEAHYAQLLALCQFLPGPASSQLGFALGLIRAGWLGALAAFVAFTAPSALLLFAFAKLLPLLEHPLGLAAIHGLKLVAVAVVAHGVLGMVRNLTPDTPRRVIAAVAAAIVVASDTAAVQLLVVGGGALLGLWFCRDIAATPGAAFTLRHSRRAGLLLLAIFAVLLALALAPVADKSPLSSVAAAFYRAGALVFGGGHVVLPLLEQAVVAPGWLDTNEFLAGYGAAQAVPGPLFTFAAYLGSVLSVAPNGFLGGALCLVAIFLPAFLLVIGALPFWDALRQQTQVQSALRGAGAAVVGLLLAALYDPLWTSSIKSTRDMALALVSFGLLMFWKWRPLYVVLLAAIGGAVNALI